MTKNDGFKKHQNKFYAFKKRHILPKSPLRRIQISTKVTIDDAINDVSNNKTQNGDSIINWNRSLYEKKGKF